MYCVACAVPMCAVSDWDNDVTALTCAPSLCVGVATGLRSQYEVEGARFLEETQRNCEQEKRRLLDNFERKKAGTVEDIVQAIVSVRL